MPSIVLLFKYNDNSLVVDALLFEYQTFSPLQKRLWWHKYISGPYMQDKSCVHATYLCWHATFIPTCNLFMSPCGLFMSMYIVQHSVLICNINKSHVNIYAVMLYGYTCIINWHVNIFSTGTCFIQWSPPTHPFTNSACDIFP